MCTSEKLSYVSVLAGHRLEVRKPQLYFIQLNPHYQSIYGALVMASDTDAKFIFNLKNKTLSFRLKQMAD